MTASASKSAVFSLFLSLHKQRKEIQKQGGQNKPFCGRNMHVLFFVLEHSLFTFFLDKKSNKKIKEKSNAPHFFPLLTHKFQNYRLQPISDLVIFFLHVISLHFVQFPLLDGTSCCAYCRRCPPALLFSMGAVLSYGAGRRWQILS
jgi:hypothetical protein